VKRVDKVGAKDITAIEAEPTADAPEAKPQRKRKT
jgi:hypothetical protein